MAEQTVEIEPGQGQDGQLFHAIQSLIAEWRGLDAGEKLAAIPALVNSIITCGQRAWKLSREAGQDGPDPEAIGRAMVFVDGQMDRIIEGSPGSKDVCAEASKVIRGKLAEVFS